MRVDIIELVIVLLIYIVIRGVMLVIRRKKGKVNYIGKEIMTALFVVYIIFVISITLVPVIGINEGYSFSEAFGRISWIPFYDMYADVARAGIGTIGKYFIVNLAGNTLLLGPIIAYLCCYNKNIRSVKNIIIVTFLISLSIESIQLISNMLIGAGRAVDTTDLVLNTISGLIGYGIFKILYKTKIAKMVKVK